MGDHKKKEANVPKQTSQATHTHMRTKKSSTHFSKGGGGVPETPTRFSCGENKSCHWPLLNVDPLRSVCVCAGSA